MKLNPSASLIRTLDKFIRSNAEIHEAVVNQSALLNDKLGEIIGELRNEQRIINDKLHEIIENNDNFTAVLNDKFREVIGELRNEQRIINDKLSQIIKSNDNAAATRGSIDNRLAAISNSVEAIPLVLKSGERTIEAKFHELSAGSRLTGGTTPSPAREGVRRALPLLRAPKTYNTDHPDYDPKLVRNFPDTLLKGDKPSANPALRAVSTITQAHQIDERAWIEQLQLALAEVKEVPGAKQLFKHKAIAERSFQEVGSRGRVHCNPGPVNLEDGLFIYWLVRRLRPVTVVETSVANGLSSGLILLALAKNGNGGRLHAIGPMFDDGVVDRESLGSMLPDNCRSALEFHDGDAKALLPEIVSKLDSIDFFFHDSDNGYDHMMFEFQEAKRKLSARAVVAADNIASNSSLWDFADSHGVPAYNFRGSVGAAFFG